MPTMKAVRAHALGEPADVLRLDDVDPPTCGPTEVVVDVEAAGLSFPNVLQCRGAYQIRRDVPFVAGTELAGTVREVGADVTTVRIGDRRAAIVPGALAEQVAVPVSATVQVPDGLPATAAVAMVGNYTTTWHALHERALLQPGEVLLVHGAAGGVGSAAVELGVAAGAGVIAVAGRA